MMLGIGTAVLAYALTVGTGYVPQDSGGPLSPPIRGTFLQLHADDSWADARLNELIHAVHRLGLSRIIVQWTVAGTKAFYPSKAFDAVPDPPLERVLALADQYDIRVRVGLAHDPQFWDRIPLSAPTRDVERYLEGLLRRSTTVARELVPIVGHHPSFDGWFLTEEVDDVNWLVPERRALLQSYLADLRSSLRGLRVPGNVAVSGFSNAHCDPSTLEQFWRELVTGTGIDVVFFQDGIGTHKLELGYLPLYLAAMKRAADASRATLSVVVELFDQVGGSPVADGPFRAVPASIDRLARQLALAADAATGETVAFSVSDYMVPAAGPEAQHLYDEYVKRYFHQGSSVAPAWSADEPSRRSDSCEAVSMWNGGRR